MCSGSNSSDTSAANLFQSDAIPRWDVYMKQLTRRDSRVGVAISSLICCIYTRV